MRSIPCVFLGYPLTQSAYICFDMSSSKTFISSHVKFVENIFPFNQQSHPHQPSLESISKWLPLAQVLPVSSGSLNTSPQRVPSCQHLSPSDPIVHHTPNNPADS